MEHTQVVKSKTNVASTFALLAERHLMTHDELNQEFFHDVVDRSVRSGELDAELGQDSTMELMSEEEFKQIFVDAMTRPRSAKSPSRKVMFVAAVREDIFKGKPVEQEVEHGVTRKRTPSSQDATPPIVPADGIMTEMGLGQPRVTGVIDNPITPINEFHQEMLKEPERLVLGGCIPSVRWSELDSIITYLNIFRDLVTPETEERLGKPARTKEELNAEIEAECNSPTYLAIVKKLRRRLLVDGVLDLDITRRLNDAKFTVSYIPTLKQLTVEITTDYKLSWEV